MTGNADTKAPIFTEPGMGENVGEITIKTFITDINYEILDLADVFGPYGTAVKILIEAIQRGLGGIWVGGHASVSNGVLHVRPMLGDEAVYGRDTGYDL